MSMELVLEILLGFAVCGIGAVAWVIFYEIYRDIRRGK